MLDWLRSADRLLHRHAGLITGALVLGILIATLWPAHRPQNGVSWLAHRPGILLHDHAVLLSEPAKTALPVSSVEMWIKPGAVTGSRTIFSFAGPEDGSSIFFVRQYKNLLQLLWSDSRKGWPPSERIIESAELFELGRPVWMAVTFGASGVKFYADGSPIEQTWDAGDLPIAASTGQLVVGSSPSGSEEWPGEILGLATFSGELGPTEVQRHYQSWIEHGHPSLKASDQCDRLYLFNEGSGSVVRNQAQMGEDLLIPERFTVLRKSFLLPLWRERFWEPWYIQDVVANILGFVPLGIAAYAFWTKRTGQLSGILPVVLFCGFLTLFIELSQYFLPTRESTMTDMATNALGGWIGAALYRRHLRRTSSAGEPNAVAIESRAKGVS